MNARIEELKKESRLLLEENILRYWTERMTDREHDGFYGRITGDDQTEPLADKGAVLNARVLWTFSSAYRVLKNPVYLDMAERAKKYLLRCFYDTEFGGVYWSVDFNGRPRDTKKQIYALGFALYGLSEFHRATGNRDALEYAIKLYNSIERYSRDDREGGYLEALTRDWKEIGDMRLSLKDANEKKTMNTHLHILEPYTNLYRVWKDETLALRLRELIRIFLDRILNEDGHLGLFFDENWNSKSQAVSYGHDIEASWLLHEAALVLGDAELLKEVERVVPRIAEAAAEGLQEDGSLIYEYDREENRYDGDRHWWVQAEAVVGYLNLYEHFGDEKALDRVEACLGYIKEHLVDARNGEWFWSIRHDGTVNRDDDKAGFWKCPYHNGRMCIEILERFSS